MNTALREMNEIKEVLLWSVGINYGILLIWFAAFVYRHDLLYRLHSRWFARSVGTFDVIHYASMATYKVGIILFNLVPLIAFCQSKKA